MTDGVCSLKGHSMLRLLRPDGLHASLRARLQGYDDAFRNRSVARKLRVRSIGIGRGAHLVGLDRVRVGENFSAGNGLWLEAVGEYAGEKFCPEIIIGDDVSISFWGHIAAVNHVEIGSGVMIGSRVLIIDHNHGSYGPNVHSSPKIPPRKRPLSRGRVVIGGNVWIGDGVAVMPDSEIGEGSIIGANAVVTGNIPSYTIAVGIPAKPIKRFDFDEQQWVKLLP